VELATVGDWVEMPERDAVWAATRAGVVEIARDGTRTTLYPGSATAIARGAGPDDEQEALDRAAMEFGTD
jgi:hypothetical protein